MFGFMRKTKDPEQIAEAPTETAVEDVTAPIGTIPEALFDEGRERIRLAKALGCLTADAAEEELREFLRENNIAVFKTSQVAEYIKAMATKSDAKWKLSPLGHSNDCVWAHRSFWNTENRDEEMKPYRGTIPLPVLLTIQKLRENFRDRLRLFVAHADTDPFLGAVVDDCAIVFVERWDEPTFRS